MPKIIAHKVWNYQLDKGAYARHIQIDLKKCYGLDECEDEKVKVAIKKAMEMEFPYPYQGNMFLFGDWLFELTPYEIALEPEKLKLLLLEAIDKEREKFERLKRKFSKATELVRKREPIPEEVRILVWRRDSGQCVKCGSQENIEYDHIIPVSKGGSNTVRNIQLLCEKCNRNKHNSI